MIPLQFTKMQGIGNDYIYLDYTKKQEPQNMAQLVPQMSNRHFGIGSDGVILILPSLIADFKMKMYNADASEWKWHTLCGKIRL